MADWFDGGFLSAPSTDAGARGTRHSWLRCPGFWDTNRAPSRVEVLSTRHRSRSRFAPSFDLARPVGAAAAVATGPGIWMDTPAVESPSTNPTHIAAPVRRRRRFRIVQAADPESDSDIDPGLTVAVVSPTSGKSAHLRPLPSPPHPELRPLPDAPRLGSARVRPESPRPLPNPVPHPDTAANTNHGVQGQEAQYAEVSNKSSGRDQDPELVPSVFFRCWAWLTIHPII